MRETAIEGTHDEMGLVAGHVGRALPRRAPDLAAVGRELRSLGITGVTDATPDLDAPTAQLLADAATDGRLPVAIVVLGSGPRPPAPLTTGPAKLLLRDHDLPSHDELAELIAGHHRSDRAVAVHCVTLDSLALTLGVLEAVGVLPGDRIEHASVCPPALVPDLRRLGVRVVNQPDFLRTRGREYLAEVDPGELPDLYPHRRFLAAGVPTTCSSDAPFGTLDPWQVVATASTRRTRDGDVIGASEAVSPATALAGYLSAYDDPGGAPRNIHSGAPADLLLLHACRDEVLASPHRDLVRATLRGDDLRAND